MNMRQLHLQNDESAVEPTNQITFEHIQWYLNEMITSHKQKKNSVKIMNLIDKNIPLIQLNSFEFEQIFLPIFHNALLNTNEGFIAIRAEYDQNNVSIIVEDTGVGIEAEHIPHLFDPFYQVNPVSEQQLGLGLTIAKRFAEKAGGKIEVQSRYGYGSTFTVTLPNQCKEISNPPTSPKIVKKPFSLHKKGNDISILIIHEQSKQLEELMKQTEKLPYTIYGVCTLKESEQLLEKKSFDLILLDCYTFHNQDISYLQKLRETKGLYELPVLLLTTSSYMYPAYLQKIQANDYMKNPIDLQQLQTTINFYNDLKQLTKQATRNELKSYVAQISPHFLYNTLNMLITLNEESPLLVEEMLHHLTTYFRAKLSYIDGEKLVSLTDELELIQAYMSIEQLRFEHKINIEYEENINRHTLIPALTIQTIIEHCINDIILKNPKGGTLRVEAYEEEEVIINIQMPEEQVGECAKLTSNEYDLVNDAIERLQKRDGNKLSIEVDEHAGTMISIKLEVDEIED